MTARASNRAALAIVVVALTFLHFALRPATDHWVASPNLLLCAVLVAARELRSGTAAGVGFVLGLLEDAMAGVSNFGLATLLLVPIAYIGSRTRDLFVGEELLFMGAYLFVGTWLYEVLTYLVAGSGGALLSHLFVRAPLDGLTTAVVGYLTVPLVGVR